MVMSVLLLLCFCSQAQSDDGKIKWHGFAAQGIIQAEGSNFVNNDGDVSLELTEIGLNASYRINRHFRVAGQGVYLNGGNRFANGARLDYLFLDWQIHNTFDSQINVFLGRNKNYHRLYSATRDVPHTRSSIVLPQSLYIDVFRDVSIGTDGIFMRGHFNNSLGEWDVNWNYGFSEISDKQLKLFVSPLAQGDLKLEFEHQASFNWRPKNSQMELGASILDSKFDYKASENEPFINGQTTVQGLYLNYQYNSEFWSITSELVRFRFVTDNFLFPDLHSDAQAEGGYVQGKLFFSSSLSAMLRLDIYDADRKDRDGALQEATTGIPRYFGFMDQATVGLTWNIAPNWRLQGEYHRVKGTARLAPILVPDLVNNNQKYWDVWALQLMYWF